MIHQFNVFAIVGLLVLWSALALCLVLCVVRVSERGAKVLQDLLIWYLSGYSHPKC